MKNIEYYYHTKDALEAWRQSVEGGVYLSFDEWAQREYEAPREQTLLEAAEAVADEWYTADVSGGNIVNLKNAIAREKSKPVRNFDRYKTSDEAYDGFKKMCDGIDKCEHCRFRSCDSICRCAVAWLYAEAGKEEAK